jgi:hypothetical protein
MRKNVHDRGDVLVVRSKPEDAIAKVRRMGKVIRQRLAANQPPLQTDAERDIVLIAIAQSLGIID